MPYFDDLDPTQPAPDAPAGLGDDEIRALKRRILDTLGGLDGPVTQEPGVLMTSSVLSSFAARIEALELGGGGGGGGSGGVPIGTIAIWALASGIPAGWKICDGKTYNLSGGGSVTTPNMAGYTIAGADGPVSNTTISVNYRAKTGKKRLTTNNIGNHNHTLSVAGHALSEAELPSHSHALFHSSVGVNDGAPVAANQSVAVQTQGGGNENQRYMMETASPANGTPTLGSSGKTGSAAKHTHTGVAASGGAHEHIIADATPPVLGVRFIMYLGETN